MNAPYAFRPTTGAFEGFQQRSMPNRMVSGLCTRFYTLVILLDPRR